MQPRRSLIRAMVLAASLSAVAGVAPAQEITESHLAAAREAIDNGLIGPIFNERLPLLADRVKGRLIRARPDLHREISDAVDAVALRLTTRRVDLDNDVARIWARTFSEEELKTIATFYQSPTGRKLSQVGPQVAAQSIQVLNSWSDRVGEELFEKSKFELKQKGLEF